VAVIMFWICFANTRERIKAPATHNNYLAELRDLLRNDQWRVVAVLVLTNIGFGVIRLGAMMYFVTYYLGSASYFMWMLGAHILGKAAGSALAKRLTQNVSKVQMFGYCSVLAGVLSIALFFAPKSVLILVPMTFIVSTLYQATTTLM
ncbi:MFS transporter, partial [Escherichia coli]